MVFNNLSTKGDKWGWDFGDGLTSTTKYPTHVFRKAGIYTVTLMADSSKYKKCAKEITVYDTIPTFSVSSDSILYMQLVTLKALFYNPYGKTATVNWQLPECAIIKDGSTESQSVTLCFTRPDTVVNVSMTIDFDGKITTVTRELAIHDNRTSGLIVACGEGNNAAVRRYRLFDTGVAYPEKLIVFTSETGYISQMLVEDDDLYMFTSRMPAGLHRANLNNTANSEALILGSAIVSGGCFYNNFLYWIDCLNENGYILYRFNLPLVPSLASKYYFASFPEGQYLTGSLAVYAGKLIYTTVNSVSIADLPQEDYYIIYGTVLREANNPQNLCIDAIAQKIYTVEDGHLWISGINGSNPRQYEGCAAKCIAIAQERGILFLANDEGIFSLPLSHNPQNTINAEPQLVWNTNDVTALVYDDTLR